MEIYQRGRLCGLQLELAFAGIDCRWKLELEGARNIDEGTTGANSRSSSAGIIG
jgi:hypothetical protein